MWLRNQDLLLSVLTLNLVHVCAIVGGEGLDELGIAPEGQSEFVLGSFALLEGSRVPLQLDLQERPRNSTLDLVYRPCHVSTVAGHFVEQFDARIVTVREDVELLVAWQFLGQLFDNIVDESILIVHFHLFALVDVLVLQVRFMGAGEREVFDAFSRGLIRYALSHDRST